MEEPDTATLNGVGQKRGGSGGTIKKIGIAAFVIFILAGLAWGGYIFFINRSNNDTADNNQDNSDQVMIEDDDVIVEDDSQNEDDLSDNTVPPPPDPETIDDDSDGLSNAEEARLGTNPFEPDTDNDSLFDQDEIEIYGTNPTDSDSDADSLFDYDEVVVWQTDPLEADTDGDGYSDGVEVNNGFNPLGPGSIDDWEAPGPPINP